MIRALAPRASIPTSGMAGVTGAAGRSLPDLLAKAGSENFPVASRLLPPRYRRRLLAVYGFARLVDDIGDDAAPADRAGLLDLVDVDLDRLFAAVNGDTTRRPEIPAVRALAATVAQCGISRQWFARLIAANRQDQQVTRYPSYASLREYCLLSATPVGRIVLGVFGVRSAAAEACSDQVCTALQLVEHWQDVAEDRRRGRVYLPGEDLDAHGVPLADLDQDRASPALRRLMRFQTERAHTLLLAGAPLVWQVRGWARVAVAGYVAGGLATIDALRRCDGEVLAATPRPRRRDLVRHLIRLMLLGRA